VPQEVEAVGVGVVRGQQGELAVARQRGVQVPIPPLAAIDLNDRSDRRFRQPGANRACCIVRGRTSAQGELLAVRKGDFQMQNLVRAFDR
jgi:hypothetical protein